MDEKLESKLWESYRQDNSTASRLQLVDHYSYLAKVNAVHYFRLRSEDDVEFNDYLQYAMVGLLEAIQRYNPEKGASFSTFANYRIKGALLNGLEKTTEQRDQYAFLRRTQRQRVTSITKHRDHEKGDLFKEMVDVTVELALSFMLIDTGFLRNEESTADELYEGEVSEMVSNQLCYLVENLPDRERLIIRNHYYHAMSFDELARLLQVSKGRISQLHKQAIQKIRVDYENNQGINKEL